MSVIVDAYVGFGSNLGDRRARIDAALESLRSVERVQVADLSAIIETAPVGPVEQGVFLNAVARLETSLAPRELLETCFRVEREQGRDRASVARWGPRTLDLDLLLYGDRVIDEPGLRIPHPRMHQRAFVLGPLAEIAPSVWHPELEESIQSLWERLEA